MIDDVRPRDRPLAISRVMVVIDAVCHTLRLPHLDLLGLFEVLPVDLFG